MALRSVVTLSLIALASSPVGAEAQRNPIPPLDTGTSYAGCYEPKTSTRGIEVRDLRVKYHAQSQIFTVSACLVSNLRNITRISPTYVMHTRGGAMIGAMGQPRDAPPGTDRPPLGAPYVVLPSAVEIPVAGTALKDVRPEVLAVIAWRDSTGKTQSESYSIPFIFDPQ